ncbi:MAG TPA: carboxylating nicotinate-nucleotide diphosphorylase [Longimicrobiales bacterium]|nr:carboxylating nicotinate-nucleotide diphosphorylase [Longimicrobiales bacterium]
MPVDDTAETVSRRIPAILAVDDVALQLIDLALAEDRGSGDWTTRWTVPARNRARAVITAKDHGVIAGVALAAAVFLRLDPRVDFQVVAGDGDVVAPGDPVVRVVGPGRAVLTGERVALNFLQRLSGVATMTRRFVDAVAGTGTRILDTRKTTPAWRTLEKAAVRAGGGDNHRAGLYDMVLIKENHAAIAGSLAEAIRRVQEHNSKGLPVTVEVHTAQDLEDALAAGVDRLLLDNMDTRTMADIVGRVSKLDPRPRIEASGNMTLERVPEVAATGVDYISVGAITHSAPVLDLSLTLQGT